MKKKEIVTITRNEYEELLDCKERLEWLEAEGVENWEGYDYAMDAMETYNRLCNGE